MTDEPQALEVAASNQASNQESSAPETEELQLAMESLKNEYRDVLRLTKFEGLSTKEAAASLGISESALKVRAHRAYNLLRKKLEKNIHARK